jgi:hypothetical protein
VRLPEVQTKLRALAADVRMFGYTETPALMAATLEELAEAISRKPRATNARPQSAPTTPLLRQRIRETAARFPEMTQHDIAKLLGTNQGRVSETLAGKRR